METTQSSAAVITCCQPFFHKGAFFIHGSPIGSHNIRTCIDIINSAFLFLLCISEGNAIFRHRCARQHLAVFINRKVPKLFLVCHSFRGSFPRNKVNIIR